jgi:hypothetical protein
MDRFGDYALLLEDFKYWENKKLYLELMEKFIHQKINGTQFDKEFCKMWRTDRDKTYSSQDWLNKLEHVDLTKSRGFANLMSDLFIDCDVFQPDLALIKDFEISEEELRNCVKKAFLEIKNRYP